MNNNKDLRKLESAVFDQRMNQNLLIPRKRSSSFKNINKKKQVSLQAAFRSKAMAKIAMRNLLGKHK
jgi:hypothetical protein